MQVWNLPRMRKKTLGEPATGGAQRKSEQTALEQDLRRCVRLSHHFRWGHSARSNQGFSKSNLKNQLVLQWMWLRDCLYECRWIQASITLKPTPASVTVHETTNCGVLYTTCRIRASEGSPLLYCGFCFGEIKLLRWTLCVASLSRTFWDMWVLFVCWIFRVGCFNLEENAIQSTLGELGLVKILPILL